MIFGCVWKHFWMPSSLYDGHDTNIAIHKFSPTVNNTSGMVLILQWFSRTTSRAALLGHVLTHDQFHMILGMPECIFESVLHSMMAVISERAPSTLLGMLSLTCRCLAHWELRPLITIITRSLTRLVVPCIAIKADLPCANLIWVLLHFS